MISSEPTVVIHLPQKNAEETTPQVVVKNFMLNKVLLLIMAAITQIAIVVFQRPVAGALAAMSLVSKNNLIDNKGIARSVGVIVGLFLIGTTNSVAMVAMVLFSIPFSFHRQSRELIMNYWGRPDVIYNSEQNAYEIQYLERDSNGEDKVCNGLEVERENFSKVFSDTYLYKQFSVATKEWRLPDPIVNGLQRLQGINFSCFKAKSLSAVELKAILKPIAVIFLVSTAIHKIALTGMVVALFGVIAGSLQVASWGLIKNLDTPGILTCIAVSGMFLLTDMMLWTALSLSLLPIFTIATVVSTAVFTMVPSLKAFAIGYWGEMEVKQESGKLKVDWDSWDKHLGPDVDLVLGHIFNKSKFVNDFKAIISEIQDKFKKDKS